MPPSVPSSSEPPYLGVNAKSDDNASALERRCHPLLTACASDSRTTPVIVTEEAKCLRKMPHTPLRRNSSNWPGLCDLSACSRALTARLGTFPHRVALVLDRKSTRLNS